MGGWVGGMEIPPTFAVGGCCLSFFQSPFSLTHPPTHLLLPHRQLPVRAIGRGEQLGQGPLHRRVSPPTHPPTHPPNRSNSSFAPSSSLPPTHLPYPIKPTVFLSHPPTHPNSAELLDTVLDALRKEAENCDCLQGTHPSPTHPPTHSPIQSPSSASPPPVLPLPNPPLIYQREDLFLNQLTHPPTHTNTRLPTHPLPGWWDGQWHGDPPPEQDS